MITRTSLWDLYLSPDGNIRYAVYEWLDLGLLYTDGKHIKSYEEDYAPLLF